MEHGIRALCAALALLALASAPAAAGGTDPRDGKDEENLVAFSKEHPLGEPKPDKALIYVVRPTSAGFAVKSWFFSDDQALGVNRGSSYFFADVEPGKHVFWSKSENVDAVELEVEAGQTYYLQQHVKIGGLKGFVDGIMGNSSARFYEPYLTSGERGSWRPMMEPAGNMERLLLGADANGHWPQVHAIGDEAIDILLDLYEKVMAANGSWFGKSKRYNRNAQRARLTARSSAAHQVTRSKTAVR